MREGRERKEEGERVRVKERGEGEREGRGGEREKCEREEGRRWERVFFPTFLIYLYVLLYTFKYLQLPPDTFIYSYIPPYTSKYKNKLGK